MVCLTVAACCSPRRSEAGDLVFVLVLILILLLFLFLFVLVLVLDPFSCFGSITRDEDEYEDAYVIELMPISIKDEPADKTRQGSSEEE